MKRLITDKQLKEKLGGCSDMTIWRLRRDGLPLYFTMDAGPNLKLLFESEHAEEVAKQVGGLHATRPFG